MFTVKVLLLIALGFQEAFSYDAIQLLNDMYSIKTNCNKEVASIEILENGNYIFSDLFSDPKIVNCLVLQKVQITTSRSNVTLEFDRAFFRDNQTFLLMENIRKVSFLSWSLGGYVNVVFQDCPSILFHERSITEATAVEVHLYESALEESGAFQDFDKFLLVDHSSESTTQYDWIVNKHNGTSKTVIIAGNSKTTPVISNLYSQFEIAERNKCTGIYIPILVFCILIICLAIIGISLIWTIWILGSERKLLKWYVAEAVGDEEEFIEEHVLLRNGNVVKSGIRKIEM